MKQQLAILTEMIVKSETIESAVSQLAEHLMTTERLSIEKDSIDHIAKQLLEKLRFREMYVDNWLYSGILQYLKNEAIKNQGIYTETTFYLGLKMNKVDWLRAALVSHVIMPALYQAVNQPASTLKYLTINDLNVVGFFLDPSLLITKNTTLSELEISVHACNPTYFLVMSHMAGKSVSKLIFNDSYYTSSISDYFLKQLDILLSQPDCELTHLEWRAEHIPAHEIIMIQDAIKLFAERYPKLTFNFVISKAPAIAVTTASSSSSSSGLNTSLSPNLFPAVATTLETKADSVKELNEFQI